MFDNFSGNLHLADYLELGISVTRKSQALTNSVTMDIIVENRICWEFIIKMNH